MKGLGGEPSKQRVFSRAERGRFHKSVSRPSAAGYCIGVPSFGTRSCGVAVGGAPPSAS